MRDKFTELIEKGVAQRQYVLTISEIPNLDLFSRMYNNVFGVVTDTHMSNISGTDMGDDVRVITGHMINTPKWDEFISYPNWCHMNFYNSCGSWCLSEFLYKNGYRGEKGTLNSDIVYFVKPISQPEAEAVARYAEVQSFTTSESKIPRPVVELTTNGDVMKIKECLNSKDVIKSLNESLYIRGNQWTISNDNIIGLIGNTVVYLNK